MTKRIRMLTVIFISSLIFVSFQNCNKIQLSDLAVGSSNDLGAPADTAVVMEACISHPVQKATKNYLFPKPAMTCEWEKDGNLQPRNDYLQARIEQEENLQLPPGAIICDVKFQFEKQQFLYDDHFLLSFNGAVIASSFNFETVLTRKSNLLRYNWAAIAGMYWDKKMEGTHCSMGSQCSWPITDTPGYIIMNFDPLMFQQLMAEDLTRNDHSLKFVSIGDNDVNDCEHSDVSFTLEVDYVIKP